MTKEEIERRMILENQNALMVALIALLPRGHAAAPELYYHSAKTQAYIRERS